jgi:prepilin-type N-terminal cleavage/methylation domain-containing protein
MRKLRVRRDERGVTLIEVTLTMLILAILLTVAFDFLDRASLITVKTDAQSRAEDDTQRALRTVTQHLRGAAPITGACTGAGFPTSYSNCVRFDVPRVATTAGHCAVTKFVIGLADDGDATNPADERDLRVDRQEVTGASCSGPVTPPKTVVLARVVNDGTQPLFTYYGQDGNAIPATATASVPKAATVRVLLSVRYRAGSNPIVFTNSAALRNNISR